MSQPHAGVVQMNDEDVKAGQAKPSIARTYSYLLGDRDYYAVDQEIGQYFMDALPGSVRIATTARRAVERAVREIARDGVGQFIDFGCGLPTVDNVHQIAQRELPDARVVYVDNDPIVVAHGRARMATDGQTIVILADARDPASIYDNADARSLLDFDQPVGLLFSAVLGFVNDDEDPYGIVRFWVERIASGSRVYIAHFRSGYNEETVATEQKLQGTWGRGRWRGDSEITKLFAGLDILPPGLVPCAQWRPESGPREITSWEQLIVSGLAAKP
ncbi:SAM-dependent methyltransferase [Nocardia sp. CDC159]|uniref:SAM-dependent methyltransferase n=1 Tax=Nocardia pulmonis TaxID=2951408 RepID=A0A9X2E4L8_9NOCA|nr:MULTISPECIES: SAM-dependent methyltransferase [Nocardia]MCM6774134.1 SAM-dependent methyltransferase [Nocardia pulmonis]MCM6787021.1 SAM-dependent methyltransferase [Nocardia sp. CDC159]